MPVRQLVIFTLFTFVLSVSAQADRARLGYDQLTSPNHPVAGPVDNGYFMPQEGAAASHHAFSGAIIVPEHAIEAP